MKVLPCVALALSLTSISAEPARLVVLDLDDGQVRGPAKEIFGRDIDLGHGVRNLLAQQLKQSGYTIVEWKTLDQLFTQQGLPPDNRGNPEAVKRIARIVDQRVDAIVMGNITHFGQDSKAGLATIDHKGKTVPMMRFDSQIVKIQLRVMSVESGEVILTCDGNGEAVTMGKSSRAPLGGSRLTGRDVDFSTPDFAATVPGEAITKAVQQAGERLIAARVAVKPRVIPLDAPVLRVDGDRIELELRTPSTLRRGETIAVDRLAQEVRDPATGRLIRRIWQSVGSIEITEVRGDLAVARVVSGTVIQPGDVAGAARESAPRAPVELLAAILTREIEKRRTAGFDEDLAIQPSSADLRTARTVFVQPMSYDLHVFIAQGLRKSNPPLFEVLDDPRKADLWILGKAGWTGKMGSFQGSVDIVPRGTTTVLWSAKSGAGMVDARKDTVVSSAAKKLVSQMVKSLAKE